MSSLIQSLNLPVELTIPAAIEAFADESFLLVLDSAARHRELDSRYSFLTADPVANSLTLIRRFPLLREELQG